LTWLPWLDALLGSAGLQPRDVEDPDAFLSPMACAAVFANADRQRRVPNLALQLAQRTPVGANPLLDYLVVTSDSVGQAVERLTRYLRLVNPSVGLVIRRECSPVRLVVERAQVPLFTELTLSLCVIRLAHETDGQFRAAYVSFTHQPDDVVEYAIPRFTVPSDAGTVQRRTHFVRRRHRLSRVVDEHHDS
jgi:AraC-type transcriptional regulator